MQLQIKGRHACISLSVSLQKIRNFRDDVIDLYIKQAGVVHNIKIAYCAFLYYDGMALGI